MDRKAEFTNGVPTLGGALWIDLINSKLTIGGNAMDFLAADRDFAGWASVCGLRPEAVCSSDREAALELRTVLERAFADMRRGALPPKQTLDVVNALLAGRLIGHRLEADTGHLELREIQGATQRPVATAIAYDFARFAEDFEADRMKRCDNPDCTMQFYDRGKNNRRRWCSTSICGNRDKIANYRARKAAAAV